ncbi:undecaprenyl-diphosphate phosphatase [Oleiharenicola lentus]|uniref:Undecaprenyl-diphosphatase n=1 Tax=Oleiharenicola lentus TaxID=2508720 RepID=A0A4Q1CCR1_9BACT|nr:undecaprenyl-diphosphate phosphatase [Oleiharenicola lentus]
MQNPGPPQSIKLDSTRALRGHGRVISALRTLCATLLLTATLGAAEPAGPQAAPAPAAELSVGDAIVLGVVEGVTEFLPISSTGHLIIANRVLGLESEAQLKDKDGQPLWHKRPTEANPDGEPLTLKLAADTYAVVIQVGAIAAVLFLYAQQLFLMVGGLFGRSSAGLRLLRNVALAFLPVVVFGLLLHDLIDQYLFSVWAVIVALVAGAILMLWAERWREARIGVGRAKGDAADLPPRNALLIGLGQCLALWPGTSRSMVTIVGGYLAGLSPAKAAEFSFLVGLPTLGGAALYKGVKSGPAMIEVFGWSNVLLGAGVASISALIAVKFLVHIISRYGLAFFAYYRLALALILTIVYLL